MGAPILGRLHMKQRRSITVTLVVVKGKMDQFGNELVSQQNY